MQLAALFTRSCEVFKDLSWVTIKATSRFGFKPINRLHDWHGCVLTRKKNRLINNNKSYRFDLWDSSFFRQLCVCVFFVLSYTTKRDNKRCHRTRLPEMECHHFNLNVTSSVTSLSMHNWHRIPVWMYIFIIQRETFKDTDRYATLMGWQSDVGRGGGM